MITLTTAPIDAAALLAQVADPTRGALTLFVGTVRDVNDGRAVQGIDYQAYGPMAESELRAIVAEAHDEWPGLALAIAHRTGYLALGEASVVIAVGHARRGAALDAQRYCIEQLKARVPIWKREHYADGTREWVDPTRTAATTP
ncbi:MAG: molybdenum cofactor biosynthesis protein MoaE [Gemmatimonadaceae bacterium]|nr:molybdenum cofactor biosynthesis protein MoaE [Gemmatimonadaceae bacterium]